MLGFTGLAVAIALAQVGTLPGVSFTDDAFLLGDWQCALDRPGQRRRSEEAHYSLDLGGKWLSLRYRVVEDGKRVSETQAYETYDPKLAKWVYTSFTSEGAYGTSYSDGWRGNRKLYRPSANAPNQFTLTTTKLSDRRFTERIDVPTVGDTKTIFLLDCSKRQPRLSIQTRHKSSVRP